MGIQLRRTGSSDTQVAPETPKSFEPKQAEVALRSSTGVRSAASRFTKKIREWKTHENVEIARAVTRVASVGADRPLGFPRENDSASIFDAASTPVRRRNCERRREECVNRQPALRRTSTLALRRETLGEALGSAAARVRRCAHPHRALRSLDWPGGRLAPSPQRRRRRHHRGTRDSSGRRGFSSLNFSFSRCGEPVSDRKDSWGYQEVHAAKMTSRRRYRCSEVSRSLLKIPNTRL